MKKYYIYHIPGVKIGCSNQPEYRVNKQGYTYFEILEKHSDIYKASEREIELQKEYGYDIDTVPYYISKNNRKKFTKEESDRGRETMIKNGFFKEWYKKGVANRIRSVAKCDKITGEIIEVYNSVSDAARSINREGNTTTICSCCNNKKNSYMGYKWKYMDTIVKV